MDCTLPADYLRKLQVSGLLEFKFEDMLENIYSKIINAGETVVDVGAHNGRHTKAFLSKTGPSGRVFAFEPIPEKQNYLSKNIKASNFNLIKCALSNENGQTSFFVAHGSLEESGLKKRIYTDPSKVTPKEITVELRKLDDFKTDLKGLSFVKIDIEGAEILMLEGSEDILNTYRPIVSVEYGYSSYSAYGNTADTLYDLSKKLGYSIYDIFLNRLDSLSKWRGSVDFLCWDFIMVPFEREEEFIEKVVLPDRAVDLLPYPVLLSTPFASIKDKEIILAEGFSEPEEWGVWTNGHSAEIRINRPLESDNDLILELSGHCLARPQNEKLEAKVLCDGKEIGTISTKGEITVKSRIPIAKDLFSGEPLSIVIEIANPISPADLGCSNDHRLLGYGLSHITVYDTLSNQKKRQ